MTESGLALIDSFLHQLVFKPVFSEHQRGNQASFISGMFAKQRFSCVFS